MSRLLIMMPRCNLISIVNRESQSGRIDIPVSHDQRDTEDRLRQEVENAVEDSFTVGRDEIGALGDSPRDGIDRPDEQRQDTAEHVGPIDVRAQHLGASATLAGELVEDVEHGDGAECPPT